MLLLTWGVCWVGKGFAVFRVGLFRGLQEHRSFWAGIEGLVRLEKRNARCFQQRRALPGSQTELGKSKPAP